MLIELSHDGYLYSHMKTTGKERELNALAAYADPVGLPATATRRLARSWISTNRSTSTSCVSPGWWPRGCR